MAVSHTPAELQTILGEGVRALRLDRNLHQQMLAEQAGVSVHAVMNLERGKGASVNTLVRVLRALGREDWLKSLAPAATINPLTLTRAARPRQRARRRHASDGK